jgi:type II secretory pathway component PulC
VIEGISRLSTMVARTNNDEPVVKENGFPPALSHSRTSTPGSPGKPRISKSASPSKKEVDKVVNKSSAKDVAELKDYVRQTKLK